MAARRQSRSRRRKIGRVSLYQHHGSWWIYYRDGGRQVRRSVASDERTAEQIAAETNAQLTASAPTAFSFLPATLAELQAEFIDYHEAVLRSSLATVRRYRSATQHLVSFAAALGRKTLAHELQAEQFVRYLRTVRISPNGHANSRRRPLREKGIKFILETCRAMYGYAARHRRMPPYAPNPFAGLGGKRIRIDDAKRIFLFNEASQVKFLQAADDWSFPIHFLLATTGIRPGELAHLLIEDVDLNAQWLRVTNKPELGWRVKTRRDRQVPLLPETCEVLGRVIGRRTAGVLFRRRGPETVQQTWTQLGLTGLIRVTERARDTREAAKGSPLTREEVAQAQRRVWRDAGAIRVDQIRQSFMATSAACGFDDATCPKSWRHSFATLLQDANVDPLIRQLTMGHSPSFGPDSALGMTATYTHTRWATQQQAIERALRLWPLPLAIARQWAQRNTHA
jgi:integrase